MSGDNGDSFWRERDPVVILVVGAASMWQMKLLADACEERGLIVDHQIEPSPVIQGLGGGKLLMDELTLPSVPLGLRAREDFPAIRYNSSKRKGKGRNKGGNKWWE